jgi:mRNA-degrading endonuclease RelE of RelBE toxin-antitoxin system
MAWRVEISSGARKALGKLDPQVARGILKFFDEKVARASDPTSSTASTA